MVWCALCCATGEWIPRFPDIERLQPRVLYETTYLIELKKASGRQAECRRSWQNRLEAEAQTRLPAHALKSRAWFSMPVGRVRTMSVLLGTYECISLVYAHIEPDVTVSLLAGNKGRLKHWTAPNHGKGMKCFPPRRGNSHTLSPTGSARSLQSGRKRESIPSATCDA